MWFLVSIACFILGLVAFVYVFSSITACKNDQPIFETWYVEFISLVAFSLFGCSLAAMIKFICDIVKILV